MVTAVLKNLQIIKTYVIVLNQVKHSSCTLDCVLEQSASSYHSVKCLRSV